MQNNPSSFNRNKGISVILNKFKIVAATAFLYSCTRASLGYDIFLPTYRVSYRRRMTRRRRMTMKKAKRRMMARKGKKMRTMMTRDSLTSSNLQRGRTVRKMPPTSSTTSCRTRSSTHCEQIIHLDSIMQVEREDYADAIRLLDAAT